MSNQILEFIARLCLMAMGVASLGVVFVMGDAMDSILLEGLFTLDRLKDTVCVVIGMIFFFGSGFFFIVAIPKKNPKKN